MSANKFELKPCIGVVVGTERSANPQTIEWDQDEIWCNGVRIGHISHHAGAVCRIHRFLSEPTKREVVEAVKQLRASQGKPPIGETVSALPNPSAIKASLQAAGRITEETDEEDDDE